MIRFASLNRTYVVAGGHFVVACDPPINALRPPLLPFLLPAFFSAFSRSLRGPSLASSCALSLRPSLLRESAPTNCSIRRCGREKRGYCVHLNGVELRRSYGMRTSHVSIIFYRPMRDFPGRRISYQHLHNCIYAQTIAAPYKNVGEARDIRTDQRSYSSRCTPSSHLCGSVN